MDEMMLLRMLGAGFGSGFGSGFDVSALIAFIAFAAIFLIAPVIGYRPKRPAGMVAALYLLIGYGGVSLVQMLLQWAQLLDRTGFGQRGRGEESVHFLFGFAVLKVLVFLTAMVAFVIGLSSLRLREPIDE